MDNNNKNNTNNTNKKWQCAVCNIAFDRRNHLEKHLQTNKHKIRSGKICEEYDKCELIDQLQLFKSKCSDLEERMEKLEKQLMNSKNQSNKNSGNTTYINYSNCGNVTNNIIINVNPHGNENWDFLEQNVVLEIMKGVNTCIPNIVKSLHFHKEHPENQNIRITNKKLSEIKLYNGSKWITKNKKDTIESLITNVVDKLESDFGEEFKKNSTKFIHELWEKKIIPIVEKQKISSQLRKQVEYSIINGQNELTNTNNQIEAQNIVKEQEQEQTEEQNQNQNQD